jgi:hypothetical protein
MAKLFFAPLVMSASRTYRDSHDACSLGQAEVVIEDQLQGFSLSRGQTGERAAKQRLNL